MRKITLSLALIALGSSLWATQDIELKPLSISSTAIKTDELKATEAVEVYTSKDIEKAHVQNLYEFLGKYSSVFTTSAYGNPFMQKIDMRGYGVGNGYQNIVVTINGRKLNNVDMVPQLLASISPMSIKKIEIIKSSGIVVAGDGANAGVINIITKKSNDKEISFYGGTYQTADGAFYLGHSDDKLSISLNGEAQKHGGSREIDSKGNKDANKFSTFNLNLSYNVLKDLEVSLDAFSTKTDVIYGGTMTKKEYKSNPMQQGSVDYGFGATPSSSTHQTYNSNALTLGTKYYINDNLSFNANISEEKKQSNFITYTSIYDYDYKSAKASLDYDSDIFSLTLGFDGFKGNMRKDSSTIDLTKTNKAGFIMSEFYLNNLTLKAGYRYEKINFEQKSGRIKDDNLNGVELGANYLLDSTQSIFANYSRSYESTSLDRLINFFSGAYTGYVKPSKANNYELGYTNITNSNKLKTSIYYIDLKDEIYYYADPTFVNSKNTNIDKSYKYGLDIYDKYIINQKFNLVLNYNYIQAIIDKEKINGEDYSGNKLPGVSNHNLKATLTYLPNRYATLALTQTYRSRAYAADDFNNNFSQKQDAFYSTDISATYAKDNWEIFAKINNLFNQTNGLWIKDDAIYPVNYTTTAMAGLKLKF